MADPAAAVPDNTARRVQALGISSSQSRLAQGGQELRAGLSPISGRFAMKIGRASQRKA
jgi:hypothetical protein